MIFVDHGLHCDSKLPHIVHTLNPLRPGFDLRNGRQQQRGENSDDGDDHQQFDQGKTGSMFALHND